MRKIGGRSSWLWPWRWLPAAVLAQPDVTARGAIIVDADTGAVIWEQNADEPLPPASTTKVMTAILALQSHRLDEQFPVSANAAATPPSKIGLRPGQSVAPPRPALRRAPQVGERRGGRRGRGRRRLRARVRAAHEPEGARHRCVATNFVNPHGLTEYGHVTTARDLSRIFRYGLGVPRIPRGAQHAVRGGSDRRPERRAPDARALAQPAPNAPDFQVIGKTGLHASRAPLLRRRRRSRIARGRHRHPRVHRSLGRRAPHARLRSQPLAADARADGRRIGAASARAGSRGGAGAGRRGCPGRAQAAYRRGARRSATRARPSGGGRSPGRTRSPGRGRSRRAVAGAGSRARASRQDGACPARCRRPAAGGADPRGRGAGCA